MKEQSFFCIIAADGKKTRRSEKKKAELQQRKEAQRCGHAGLHEFDYEQNKWKFLHTHWSLSFGE